MAQLSPVFGILPHDINQDGNLDLILGGNLYGTRVKFGRYDSSKGEVFLGDGKGGFNSMPYNKSGIFTNGEVRDILKIMNQDEIKILFVKNNSSFDVYTPNKLFNH